MGPASYDVVISGAGPAGCAAAITLADYAPDLRICLIDAGHGGECNEPVTAVKIEYQAVSFS